MKFNPNHDEQGRFTTADNAVDQGTQDQYAYNDIGQQTDASTRTQRGTQNAQQVAQDLSQTCAAYIAANRQGKVLRQFPGQFLSATLQEVIAASKAGDPAAKKACKLLFDNRFNK